MITAGTPDPLGFIQLRMDQCENTITIAYGGVHFNNLFIYSMTLSVDNETTLTESIPGFVMFEQILVGGSSSLTSPISEIFRGCMDSVTVNGRYE